MESNNFTLSFKSGINKYHIGIVILVIVLFFIFKPSKQDAVVVDNIPPVTQAVLKALREQNRDKPLEYNEVKPTYINSMTKHLRNFDALIETDLEKAKGQLIIVRRRLQYMENKELDISDAEKVLNDHLNLYFNHFKVADD